MTDPVVWVQQGNQRTVHSRAQSLLDSSQVDYSRWGGVWVQ